MSPAAQVIEKLPDAKYSIRSAPIVDRHEPEGHVRPIPTPCDYQVVARVAQTVIDPGKPFDIEVYFTGSGLPSAYKFAVVFPKHLLAVDSTKSTPEHAVYGTATAALTPAGLGEGGWQIKEILHYADPHSAPLDDIGVVLMLNESFFSNRTRKTGFPDMLPQTLGELKVGEHAPIWIQSKLSSKAPSGDHVVRMVLTYVSEGVPKTAAQDLILHIRPFWERPWFQYMAVVAATLTIAAAALAIYHIFVPSGW